MQLNSFIHVSYKGIYPLLVREVSISLSPTVFSRCHGEFVGVTWCPLAGAQPLGKGQRLTQGTVRAQGEVEATAQGPTLVAQPAYTDACVG